MWSQVPFKEYNAFKFQFSSKLEFLDILKEMLFCPHLHFLSLRISHMLDSLISSHGFSWLHYFPLTDFKFFLCFGFVAFFKFLIFLPQCGLCCKSNSMISFTIVVYCQFRNATGFSARILFIFFSCTHGFTSNL